MSQSYIKINICAKEAEKILADLEQLFEEDGYPIAIFTNEAYLEKNADWVFELYTPTNEVQMALQRIKNQLNLQLLKHKIEIREIKNQDWVKTSLDNLKPVIANRFFVYSSHDKDKIPAGAISIQIEASQAFGTGHHGTTFGCLLAIDHLIKQRKYNHILDLGTGSGVLAIAIAKTLHTQVIASDCDPLAINIAHDNAHLNKVGQSVLYLEAFGFHHPVLQKRAPYDLIVANILADPLILLANEISHRVKTAGSLVLSGLLERQANRVTSAYVNKGFALLKRAIYDGWVTLTFIRR